MILRLFWFLLHESKAFGNKRKKSDVCRTKAVSKEFTFKRRFDVESGAAFFAMGLGIEALPMLRLKKVFFQKRRPVVNICRCIQSIGEPAPGRPTSAPSPAMPYRDQGNPFSARCCAASSTPQTNVYRHGRRRSCRCPRGDS